jgi:hypothetical protein
MTAAIRRPSGELSERDHLIISDVARFRLLTTRQIEQWHFPATENGSQISAARRTRRVLQRLVAERYLAVLDRRVGGIRAGSAGQTFALDVHGQQLLAREGRRRAPTTPGARFVDHTLAIAEVVVGLVEQARDRPELELLTAQPEPESWRTFTVQGARTVLKPDLFVAVAVGEYEYLSACEIDRATEALPTIRAKCDQYYRCFRTGQEQERSGAFPQVVWICPHERRANQLRQLCERLPQEAGQLFAVATDAEAVAVLTGDLPPDN